MSTNNPIKPGNPTNTTSPTNTASTTNATNGMGQQTVASAAESFANPSASQAKTLSPSLPTNLSRNSLANSVSGQQTLVDRLTTELAEAAGVQGLQAANGLFAWARAANGLRRGEWTEANNSAQEWIEGAADFGTLSVTLVFSQAMAAYTAAAIGDVARANQLTHSVLAHEASTQYPEIAAWCWAALGSLAYAQGNSTEALDYLARVADVADRGSLAEPTRLYWEGDWIDALLDSGKTDDASVVVNQLRERAASTGDLWSLGVVARSEARMQSSPVRAEELFHQAMSVFEEGRLGFEVARTFCTRGAYFRGEKASASFDIAEGFRRLQRIGAVQWTAWSAGLLRSQSENLRGRGSSHVGETAKVSNDGQGVAPRGVQSLQTATELRPNTVQISNAAQPLQLTPSELRVASLITTGSSYKEIASALFISAKTVDFHVQAMYRKAKVNNRVEFVSSFLRMAHA
jgi:DNA-binding CsgD family transcriptional regulator